MDRRARLRLLCFLAVGALVALDLWSKAAVFAWLPRAEGLVRDSHGHLRFPLVGQWLAFMLSYNPGAAFGRLGGYPHLLVIGRGAAVLCLSWLLLRTDLRHGVVLVAMILVLAGAIGNLCDNLGLGGVQAGHPYGTVRDFIDVFFTRWDWHFPTFNVADSCISVGAFLWVLSGFIHRAPAQGRETPSAG